MAVRRKRMILCALLLLFSLLSGFDLSTYRLPARYFCLRTISTYILFRIRKEEAEGEKMAEFT